MSVAVKVSVLGQSDPEAETGADPKTCQGPAGSDPAFDVGADPAAESGSDPATEIGPDSGTGAKRDDPAVSSDPVTEIGPNLKSCQDPVAPTDPVAASGGGVGGSEGCTAKPSVMKRDP